MTNFENSPVFIGNSFYGHGNPKLTSLKGITDDINGNIYLETETIKLLAHTEPNLINYILRNKIAP